MAWADEWKKPELTPEQEQQNRAERRAEEARREALQESYRRGDTVAERERRGLPIGEEGYAFPRAGGRMRVRGSTLEEERIDRTSTRENGPTSEPRVPKLPGAGGWDGTPGQLEKIVRERRAREQALGIVREPVRAVPEKRQEPRHEVDLDIEHERHRVLR